MIKQRKQIINRSILTAAAAFLGLLIFYIGFIAAVESFAHALELLQGDAFFVGAISLGFGTQIGLFSYSRRLKKLGLCHNSKSWTAAGSGAGTGTSTVSMAACCLHHVGDVLPFLGISAATLFFEQYRYPLMWSGVIINMLGIAIMIRMISKNRFWPRQVFRSQIS